MRGRKRGFRGPLGLPIEVSTARAMSNAIINYPVVVRCYRTCASPSLSSFLISVPAFSFTWLHSASIFLFGGLLLSPFSLSSPSFVAPGLSISLNARGFEGRVGSFRRWICSHWFPAVYFYTRHSDYLAVIVDMTLRVPRVLVIVRCWMSCLKNQRASDPEKKKYEMSALF